MEHSAETEFVRDLLAQAHKVKQFHRVLEYEDDASWTVSLDEQADVELEYDAASHRLFVFCEIGTPPQAAASAAYGFCLRYNYHVTETGGARIAMLDEGGPLSLIYDLTETELRTGILPVVLENLESVLPAWRELVAQGLTPAEEDPEADGVPHHSLRV